MVLGNTRSMAVAVAAENLLLLALHRLVGSLWLAATAGHRVNTTLVRGLTEVLPVVGVVQGSVLAVAAAQGVLL
jgi:hypothetical protein